MRTWISRRRSVPVGILSGLILAMALVSGVVFAGASVTKSGTDSDSGFSLYSFVTIWDQDDGDYKGTTYGEAVGVTVDTITLTVLMKEFCNFGLSTDINHQASLSDVNWAVHWHEAGYADGLFDCPIAQAIMQDTPTGGDGHVRWIDFPSLDFHRSRFACLDIRAGGFCP